MSKKIWIGFGVVFVLYSALSMFVHGVLLSPIYDQVASLYRGPEEMKMWVILVTYIFFAFFFTFIFSKGYENKGIAEGVRYGIYISLMMNIPAAYATYATMPVPYALAIQWFLYGTVVTVICGVALALVFGKLKENTA